MIGWKCPNCGRCYVPTWVQCLFCVPAFIPLGNKIIPTVNEKMRLDNCLCGSRNKQTTAGCPVHGVTL